MEFTTEGGIFTLQMIQHGLWEVRVPWSVAIDGWKRDTGRDTPNKGELRDWLEANLLRFSDMVAARVDDQQPATEPDDGRVTGVCLD